MRKPLICLFFVIGIVLTSVYWLNSTDNPDQNQSRYRTKDELQSKRSEWTNYLTKNERAMTKFVRDLSIISQGEQHWFYLSDNKDSLWYRINGHSSSDAAKVYINDISIPKAFYKLQSDGIYVNANGSEVFFSYRIALILSDEEVLWGDLLLIYLQGDLLNTLRESWEPAMIYSDPEKEYAWFCYFADLP